MNRKYEEHKSSILGMNANLVSLLIYLLPFLINFIFYNSDLSYFSWLIALIVIFIEKDSKLVKFHAWQSLLMNLFYGFVGAIVTVVGVTGSVYSVVVGNAGGLATSMIVIIIVGIISIIIAILQIIAAVKAYGWVSYRLPIVGNWASKLSHEDE